MTHQFPTNYNSTYYKSINYLQKTEFLHAFMVTERLNLLIVITHIYIRKDLRQQMILPMTDTEQSLQANQSQNEQRHVCCNMQTKKSLHSKG